MSVGLHWTEKLIRAKRSLFWVPLSGPTNLKWLFYEYIFPFRGVSEFGFCKIYHFNSVIKIVAMIDIKQPIVSKLIHMVLGAFKYYNCKF